MKTVTVNGRSYNWPSAPLVVICCDGSEPAYMEIAMEQGLMPNLKAHHRQGREPPRPLGHPELHQPQQSLDRHRPPAGRARHLRQLPHRSGHRPGNDDERPEVAARAHHLRGLPEGRCEDRHGDGEGQAAPAARQGPRLRRHGGRLLLREGRQGEPEGQRHRGCLRPRRHGRAGRLFGGALGIRLRGGRQAARSR